MTRGSWLCVGGVLLAVLVVCTRAASAEGPPPATVKVAAVQFVSVMGDPEGNRARLEPLIREAAGQGAKIIVLPETAITGYLSHDIKTTWQVPGRAVTPGLAGASPAAAAETVPGPSTRAFAKLADDLDVYLTVPVLEVDTKSGQHFNTVVLVDPGGAVLLHYRKLNPWPYAERGWADRGDRGYAYVDTPYGRLALLICYDVNFEPPVLKTKKVDILLYPIAWVDDEGSDWFDARLPAIARENDMAVVGANWTVPEKPAWHGYGRSRIIDRRGNILARPAGDLGEEVLYAELPVAPPSGRAPAGE
ncbi:MAG: carbon-nitrogen hydrolase family protein [Candidatus Brocadiaceae bacterium]|nr:carbon-nitrogen hydrolase family protein [Candidatus Brocadiaceae bacterium]